MFLNSDKPIKVVLLPAWLCNTLDKDGLPLTYALDVHALRRILSVNDVAFYIAINNHLYEVLPESIKSTFEPALFAPDLLKSTLDYMLPDASGFYPDRSEVEDICMRVTNLVYGDYALEGNKPSVQHLLDILPHNELVPVDSGSLTLNDLNFKIYSLEDGVFGLEFSLKTNKTSSLKQTIQSYDSVLKLLVGLYGLERMASTPLFKHYVDITRVAEE